MRYAISSAAALLLMATGAIAAEPPKAESSAPACPRPANVIAVLQKLYPGTTLSHYEGTNARRFADAFNDGSAVTQWPADEILIARNPQTPHRAKIGFFREGCLLGIVSSSLWAVDIAQRSLSTEQDI